MQKQTTFTLAGALAGARQTLPLIVSTLAIGTVFGVLSRQKALGIGEALLMSGLVFGGSAQFLVLSLWGASLPVLTIVIATLVINIRYILMGSTLSPWFARLSWLKTYGSLFFLTDESWALMMRRADEEEHDGAFLLGSGLVLYLSWLAGTTIGQVLGSVVSNPAQWGLDFAFPAIFAALLVGMWKGKSDLLPWLVAAVVAVISAHLLPNEWYIVCGGLAGSIVGGLRDAA